jgi:anti-anti-sigma factor
MSTAARRDETEHTHAPRAVTGAHWRTRCTARNMLTTSVHALRSTVADTPGGRIPCPEAAMRNGVVEKRVVNGLTLFTLVADAAGLRRDLEAGSSDVTVPDLAIDLRQVAFVDASIVGVLVMIYRRVASGRGCLRLVGAQRGPARLLQLCDLEGVVCFHHSVEEATMAVCGRHGDPVRITSPDLPV